ncbi:hypothetical protein ACRAWF_39400 [Streptomyces sp. L7]
MTGHLDHRPQLGGDDQVRRLDPAAHRRHLRRSGAIFRRLARIQITSTQLISDAYYG